MLYETPRIDIYSGVDSYDGSGFVSLGAYEEPVLELDLAATRSLYREMVASVGVDEETLANIIDDMCWDEQVLGRFQEARWAALFAHNEGWYV